ncbi:DUF2846 domain-containing protein [Prosthecobacter sp.]|uniref:DUF2846 domain-containing protein n=1 Tax=Prosthecobacter sp. TaxID=1965333 RepID=UPI003783DC68
MKHLKLAAIALCSLLLANCASVPMASAAADAEGKQFSPQRGRASIYVARGLGVGSALVFQTILDGRVTGALAANTYQLLSVPPGQHTIIVTSAENVQQTTLTVQPGRNYFLEVSVSMGWVKGRANIQSISDAEGRRRVLGSQRAAANTYQ